MNFNLKLFLIIFVSFLLISCESDNQTSSLDSIDFDFLSFTQELHAEESYEKTIEIINNIYSDNSDYFNSTFNFRGYDSSILEIEKSDMMELRTPLDVEEYSESFFEVIINTKELPDSVEEVNQNIVIDLVVDIENTFTESFCLIGEDVSRDDASCEMVSKQTNLGYPIELDDVRYSLSSSTQTIVMYFKADNHFSYFDSSDISFLEFSRSDLSNLPEINYNIESPDIEDESGSFRLDENGNGRLVFSMNRSDISESFNSNFNINLDYGIVLSKPYNINVQNN